MIEKIFYLKIFHFLFFFCLVVSQPTLAQGGAAPSFLPVGPAPALDARIHKLLEGFQGKVWIYAKNLDTGQDYGLRADELVRTASTIKLPIMAATFDLVNQGKLNWTDPCAVTKEKKKGGTGILSQFSDNSIIDLKTATRLMIVLSDNTATNLVLDKITCDGVNEYLDLIGLKQTRSLRKVFGGGEARALDDAKLKPFGLAVSSPKEMVTLLEMLEKGQVVSQQASAEMIGILKGQQYKDGIARGLKSVPSASKSGTLDKLRSDVGILYMNRGRIAMAITIDELPVPDYTQESAGLKMIWELSQILQDGLGK